MASPSHPTTEAGNPGRATGRPGPALRWGLLALGTATMLFAVGGRWDIAAAAWVFPVLLLRFTRLGGAEVSEHYAQLFQRGR